jgi:hypothetical protein
MAIHSTKLCYTTRCHILGTEAQTTENSLTIAMLEDEIGLLTIRFGERRGKEIPPSASKSSSGAS